MGTRKREKMKIILKPMGVVIVVAMILLLAFLVIRPVFDSSAPTEPTASPAPIPATPVSTPAGTATAERGHAIFRDAAENGWQTEGWTWAKEVAWDESKTVRSGKTAIRVRFNGFEGLKFHHEPLDMRPFNRISFYIHGGGTGGQLVQVGAVCSEKPCSDKGGIRLDPLPAGKWVAVTIPLEELDLAGKPDMSAFWIQGNTDKLQPALYVDEVRLLKPDEPAPQGVSIGRSRLAGN
jgi:hypothetical protein